jgi:hypothetical protein
MAYLMTGQSRRSSIIRSMRSVYTQHFWRSSRTKCSSLEFVLILLCFFFLFIVQCAFVFRAGPHNLKQWLWNESLPPLDEVEGAPQTEAAFRYKYLTALEHLSFFQLTALHRKEIVTVPDAWLSSNRSFFPALAMYMHAHENEALGAILATDVYKLLTKITIVPAETSLPLFSESGVMLLPMWRHQITGTSVSVSVREEDFPKFFIAETMRLAVVNARYHRRLAGEPEWGLDEMTEQDWSGEYPTQSPQRLLRVCGEVQLYAGVSNISTCELRLGHSFCRHSLTPLFRPCVNLD